MQEAANKLEKDAKKYKNEAKKKTSKKNKSLKKQEAKEALSVANDLKTRVKTAHGR